MANDDARIETKRDDEDGCHGFVAFAFRFSRASQGSRDTTRRELGLFRAPVLTFGRKTRRVEGGGGWRGGRGRGRLKDESEFFFFFFDEEQIFDVKNKSFRRSKAKEEERKAGALRTPRVLPVLVSLSDSS